MLKSLDELPLFKLTKIMFFSQISGYILLFSVKNMLRHLSHMVIFFDKEIRGKKDRLKIFASKNYESSQFKELIPDETDRERMIKFVTGDPQFRPGKSLINGESATMQ